MSCCVSCVAFVGKHLNKVGHWIWAPEFFDEIWYIPCCVSCAADRGGEYVSGMLCILCLLCVVCMHTPVSWDTHSTKCIIFHQKTQLERLTNYISLPLSLSSSTSVLSTSLYIFLSPCLYPSLVLYLCFSISLSVSRSLFLLHSLFVSFPLSFSSSLSSQPQISHNMFQMWAVCMPHSGIFRGVSRYQCWVDICSK